MELKLTYYSNALLRNVDVNIHTPDKIKVSELNTVVFLHNMNEKPHNPFTEDFCKKHKLAVVFPDGGKSFWLNGKSIGQKYNDFIGDELINFLKGIGLANPYKTCIMGYESGGYGTLHTAFTHHENFSHVCVHCSSLIHKKNNKLYMGTDTEICHITSEEIFNEFLNGESFDYNIFSKIIEENENNCPEIYFNFNKIDTVSNDLYEIISEKTAKVPQVKLHEDIFSSYIEKIFPIAVNKKPAKSKSDEILDTQNKDFKNVFNKIKAELANKTDFGSITVRGDDINIYRKVTRRTIKRPSVEEALALALYLKFEHGLDKLDDLLKTTAIPFIDDTRNFFAALDESKKNKDNDDYSNLIDKFFEE